MSRPTGAVVERTLLEAPALLERAVGYTRGTLSLLAGVAPGTPTPCAGWDLIRLLRHLDDSLAAFTEAAEGGYVAPAGPRAEAPAELAASLRDRSCRLLGAWAHEPGRSAVWVSGQWLGSSVLAATGALEVAVHGWDVARACGTDRPLPDELAAALLVVAPLVVHADDRPGRFAAPYDLPPGATASARLLGFLGRR